MVDPVTPKSVRDAANGPWEGEEIGRSGMSPCNPDEWKEGRERLIISCQTWLSMQTPDERPGTIGLAMFVSSFLLKPATMLRRLEWAGEVKGETCCPVCHSIEPYPHDPACDLATLLKDLP